MAALPTLTEVCERALRLPCSPVLLPRLIQVLQKEDAPAEDLEAVIRMDPALAGATLRLANSAFFSGSTSSGVETLGEGIMRLGHKEIYRLAALSLAGRWLNQPVPGFRMEPGDLCRRSLVTAIAAEYLAEQSDRVDPRTAYTAGLIQEIGKLAVAYACAEHFPAIREHCEQAGCTWQHAEHHVFGYDHAEVGTALVRLWKFPATLIGVVMYQPLTAEAPADLLPLLVNVHAAKFIAATIGAGVGEDGFLFQCNGSLLEEWGFSSPVLEAAIPPVLDRATRLLQTKLTTGAIEL
jgi:HD-like signal output (HDOD) protein